MKNVIARGQFLGLDRLRLVGPILLVVATLIVAACNNGNGGTGY
jgi:hypothetical protein